MSQLSKVAMRVLLGLIASVVVILGAVFVVSYQLQPGEQITLFQFSKSQPRQTTQILPTEGGDLKLTGEVRKAGRPIPNITFVFLFQDYHRSNNIVTDSDGRFEYQLPPGEWRFLGPLIIGAESEVVTVLFNPEIKTPTPTFLVGASAVPRTLGLIILLGTVGANDL